MKTDKQQVASSSSSILTTTKTEIAPGGAVVCEIFSEK
jgi:hypothetical protein